MFPNRQGQRKHGRARHRHQDPGTGAPSSPAQRETTSTAAATGLGQTRYNAPSAPQPRPHAAHAPMNKRKRDNVPSVDVDRLAFHNIVKGVDREETLRASQDKGVISEKLPTLDIKPRGGFKVEERSFSTPFTRLVSSDDKVNWQANWSAPAVHRNSYNRQRFVAKINKNDYEAHMRLAHSTYYWGLSQPGEFLNVVADFVTVSESRAECAALEASKVAAPEASKVAATEGGEEDRGEDLRPSKRRRDGAYVPVKEEHGSSFNQPAANATARDARPPRENIARVKQEPDMDAPKDQSTFQRLETMTEDAKIPLPKLEDDGL